MNLFAALLSAFTVVAAPPLTDGVVVYQQWTRYVAPAPDRPEINQSGTVLVAFDSLGTMVFDHPLFGRADGKTREDPHYGRLIAFPNRVVIQTVPKYKLRTTTLTNEGAGYGDPKGLSPKPDSECLAQLPTGASIETVKLFGFDTLHITIKETGSRRELWRIPRYGCLMAQFDDQYFDDAGMLSMRLAISATGISIGPIPPELTSVPPDYVEMSPLSVDKTIGLQEYGSEDKLPDSDKAAFAPDNMQKEQERYRQGYELAMKVLGASTHQ